MAIFSGQRAFYALTFGQLVSLVGSGMTRFGLGIWVLRETGDATAFTIMLFFVVMPVGIGAIFAGPLVDALNRRFVLLAGNAVASLSTLVIALLFFGGALEFWHLYILLSINGIANAFILPAMEASVPLLVARENLGRASGLNQLAVSIDIIVSPVLAGVLLTTVGLGVIFIADFVTFGVSVLALALSAIPQPDGRADDERGKSGGLLAEFVFGLRYIAERPPFVYLMTMFMVTMLFAGIGYALATPISLSIGGEREAGMVLSSFGVGAMVSAGLLSATGGPKRRMPTMLAMIVLLGAAFAAIGLFESIPPMMGGVFFIGFSFMLMFGLNRVIWQMKAAPEVLGRIFSLRVALGISAQSLGVLIAGPLAEGVFEPLMADGGALADSVGAVIGVGYGRGMALMYILSGLVLAAFAAALFGARRVRLLEDLVPDYAPPAGSAANGGDVPDDTADADDAPADQSVAGGKS